MKFIIVYEAAITNALQHFSVWKQHILGYLLFLRVTRPNNSFFLICNKDRYNSDILAVILQQLVGFLERVCSCVSCISLRPARRSNQLSSNNSDNEVCVCACVRSMTQVPRLVGTCGLVRVRLGT